MSYGRIACAQSIRIQRVTLEQQYRFNYVVICTNNSFHCWLKCDAKVIHFFEICKHFEHNFSRNKILHKTLYKRHYVVATLGYKIRKRPLMDYIIKQKPR